MFQEPACQEQVLAYLSYGHADFRQCVHCGAVGMVENSSMRKPHLVSESFAYRKKCEAVHWNAKQQQGKLATNK